MKELIRKILKEEVKRTLNESAALVPSDFCSPLEGTLQYSAGPVVSKFGHKRKRHTHAGVDYKADSGDLLRAPYGGEVEYAKNNGKGCGNTIVIHHGSRVRTRYCHVSHFSVSVGETVNKGQKIGETGGGREDDGKGNALGPHLHYEIHTNSTYKADAKYGFDTAVNPEDGWVDNIECKDEVYINKDFKTCRKFTGRHIPKDIFLKAFELGYFINVDGTAVEGLFELDDAIYESDPGSPEGEIIGMNAKTFIEYAKMSNITDDGDPITIDNVWIACELNHNIVTVMEKETLTRDEKIEASNVELDNEEEVVLVKKKEIKKSNGLPKNFDSIPGGMNNFRTDQPTETQFLKIFNDYPEIKTVLQVNGGHAWEKGVIEGAGLKHIKINPHKGYVYGKGYTTSINDILSVMNEGGVLIHCTHGADRTGYAVAVHLMDQGVITGKEALWEYTTKYNAWDKRGYICSPHKVKRYGGGLGNWGYIKYMEAFYPLTEWCKVGTRNECHSCKNVTHLV